MKEDRLYRKLKERMEAVSLVQPQQLGILTPYWKRLTHLFKTNSFQIFLIVGFVTSLFLWFLLGNYLVKLASLLQYGF